MLRMNIDLDKIKMELVVLRATIDRLIDEINSANQPDWQAANRITEEKRRWTDES